MSREQINRAMADASWDALLQGLSQPDAKPSHGCRVQAHRDHPASPKAASWTGRLIALARRLAASLLPTRSRNAWKSGSPGSAFSQDAPARHRLLRPASKSPSVTSNDPNVTEADGESIA